jgi:hypothetical protein
MGPPPEKKVVEQALICQRYQAEVNANVCCCHVDMEMNFGRACYNLECNLRPRI